MARVKEEIDRIRSQRGPYVCFSKVGMESRINYTSAKNGKGSTIWSIGGIMEFANRRLDEAIKQIARRKGEVAKGKCKIRVIG